jgi:hypothetical protein
MTFWQCASPARWSWCLPRFSARSSRCGSPSLLWPVDGVAGRLDCHRGRGPHDNDPRTAAVSTIHSSKFSTENPTARFVHVFGCRWCSMRSEDRSSSKAKQWLERTACQPHEVWFGRRFVVDPPPHQSPSLALASAVLGQEVQRARVFVFWPG